MATLKKNHDEQGGYKVTIVAAVLILMQFLMVYGRYYSRRLQKVSFQADDYTLVLAMVFTTALCAIGVTVARLSGSANDLDAMTGAVPVEKRSLQSMFIAWTSLYGASVALSKIAILLLYVRVFTTRTLRTFAVAVWIIGSFVGATGIATIFGSIFQCMPIAYNWDKSAQGRCSDKLQFTRFIAIPNVITGFTMLVLPLPMVWRLNVDISQKIALTATFLHGAIGVVASIARLAIIFEPWGTRNMDCLATSWTIWTLVEPANYIIAACLPTWRPILVRVLPPSFFVLTKKRKSKPYTFHKTFWLEGRTTPRLTAATSDICGISRLTGPWDLSRAPSEDLGAKATAHAGESHPKSSKIAIKEVNVSTEPEM